MTIKSQVLMSINPISPANILVFLILYFTLKKKLEKSEQTKNPLVKWSIMAIVYFVILIPVYMLLCFIAGLIPPLKLIAFVCDSV